MARNVATFLWRTLFVQAICRHYIYTALELASVPLITYLNVHTAQKEGPPLSTDMEQVKLPPPEVPTHVVFGPSTEYNSKLLAAVNALIRSLASHPKIPEPADARTSVPSGSMAMWQDADNTPAPPSAGPTNKPPDGPPTGPHDPPPAVFINETSGDTVAETCRKLVSGEDDEHPGLPQRTHALCVSLQPPAKSAGAASLAYTLFMPVGNVGKKKTMFPLGKSFEEDEDLQEAALYMSIIDFSHITAQISTLESEQARQTASEATNLSVTYTNLPGWVFGQRAIEYRSEIVMVTMMAFLLPLVRRINSIEREYSAGLAEHQGVMGLTDAEFFLGHLLTIMIICLFESSSMIALFYYSQENEIAWAHGMDPSLVAFSFLMFTVSFSLQIIMLTWIFPKGWIAVISAVLLCVYAPRALTKAADVPSLGSYFLIPKLEKLATGLFPTSALASVLRIIAISRDYEGGGGWSVVVKKVLEKDNITIVELWVVMLLTDLIMAFLAWYLHRVLPWSTDNPQNPAFFLVPSYWNPSPGKTQDITLEKQDPARFEELPPDTPIAIVAKNITKVFGQKPALNGLDMKVYQARITVLLGHNGAGKSTFMSILTGMQAPTSGVAEVCGFNVTTHRSRVRQLVSFCQQTDIFFEDMNCVENLLYFGSLKGVPMDQLRRSIASTLEVVDLQDKAYAMPSELSGGMKRRLSIALTIVSEPKLLILDEPTAGMDPETRRKVWDTLQNVAKEKTLILSSHDMDEADAIGDQVVIMASGRVICSGSTTFLKKACGVGYKITLGKDPKAFNLKEVLAVVHKVVPSASVDDEKKAQVTILLKTLDHTGFAAMFRALEAASQKLGIENIGVSVASMKDVYLKINMDWAPEGKEQEAPVEKKDIDAVVVPISKKRTAFRVFSALFIKRFISLIRSWGILLGCVVLPLGLLALIGWTQTLPSLASQQESDAKIKTIPVSLAHHYPGSTIVLGESPGSSVSKRLRVLLESEGASVQKTTNARKDLGAIAKKDFSRYISTYSMAMEVANRNITLMQNPTSPIVMPIMMNLVTTSALREAMAQPVARISANIAYLQAEYVSAVQAILLYRLQVWLYWAVLPALSYSLAFTSYAAFPVPERMGGGRDVQIMTGIWGVEFVFAHFVFDMVHHALFSGVWVLLHFAFSQYTMATAGNYFLSFIFSGPAVIGMAYLLAERAESVGGAISSVLLWVYLGGMLSLLGYGLAVLAIGEKKAHYLLLLFPPYTLLSCFTKIWTADAEGSECELSKKASQELKRLHGRSATFITAGESLVKAASDEGDPFTDACKGTSLYALKYDAMGFEIVALLAVGLVTLGIMAFLISGYLPPGDAFAGKEVQADEDVEEEKKHIASLRDKMNFSEYSMLAWSLHKRFGDLRAVRGLYLALKPSECFGLLGVNGAGKTTTFQMLAGLEAPSYGDAMTKTATLSHGVRKWQSQISYCFQIGGLLDRLNAYEYLYLIGRLRGIGDADLKPMVDSIISVVDLNENARKECGVYSGGNRRKLSIGAALLGLQPFVFLDEPYAGVDVVARNKIFRAIAEIKKRAETSFMLTSHNMDECEYSCDRLTIMVDGQMMCLGTLQHLREKFGRGYRLEFLLKHTALADAGRLALAVGQHFPGIKLTEAHENVLCYHLEERIPWSALFTKLAHLQKDFQLEHALVGENSLEQIFLSFAKMKGLDARPDTPAPPVVVAPPPVVLRPPPPEPSGAASTAKSVKTA